MPQTLKNYSRKELLALLKTTGIPLKIGPFNISIESDHYPLVDSIRRLYANYSLLSQNDFIDFNIRLVKSKGIRRFYKPQINFYLDEYNPFKPLSLSEAFALFEWGMNWCIGGHAHQFLMIHSAVLAKNDKILILPGEPGSGKSTLCAALLGEGWTVYSDELALIDRQSGLIHSVCRPISLKNNSIDIIEQRYPNLQHLNIVNTSNKGLVAHFPLPEPTLKEELPHLPAKLVIFPKYLPNAPLSVEILDKPSCFLKCIENSFNYSALGQHGFDAMGNFIECVDGYNISYSSLDDAISFIEQKLSN
ncbi:HprK-related kinase A [Colwellia sp. MEBiC06753]